MSSLPDVNRNLFTCDELRVVFGGFDCDDRIEVSVFNMSALRMLDVSPDTSSSFEMELFCLARFLAANFCFQLSF